MEPEAAYHLAANRVRCGACQKDFCASCSVQPYHTGLLCAQAKELKDKKKCRVCAEVLANQNRDVCMKQECNNINALACKKRLQCGHECKGYKNEDICLPCLHPDCKQPELLDQDEDAYCGICWVSGLGSEPCVRLDCKHIFHFNCL